MHLGEWASVADPRQQYDLRDSVLLAELNLDFLLAKRNTEKSFKPLPAFPVHPP